MGIQAIQAQDGYRAKCYKYKRLIVHEIRHLGLLVLNYLQIFALESQQVYLLGWRWLNAQCLLSDSN